MAVVFTTVVPIGKTEPEGGAETTVTPGQLSLPVALKLTTAPQAPASLHTVIGFGSESVGDSQSLTVTVNEHCAELPAASVTVEFTVVVPTGKTEPEAGEETTEKPAQLSAPFTAKVTTAPQVPASAHCVMFDGHWIVGFSQSLTVTLNEQFETLPAASVALQLTVVVPTGKAEPEGGVQTTLTGVLQPSTPVTLKLTIAEHAPLSAQVVMSVGQLIDGASQSFTVTVKEHCCVPKKSVAVTTTVEVPMGKVEPEGGFVVTCRSGQPPLTCGLK